MRVVGMVMKIILRTAALLMIRVIVRDMSHQECSCWHSLRKGKHTGWH